MRSNKMRRGGVAVFTAISMVVILGIAALAIDASMLYVTRAELQRSADASALAGTWRLLSTDRLRGSSYQDAVFLQARQDAASYGVLNPALQVGLTMDQNSVNSPSGDIVLGELASPFDRSTPMVYANPNAFNSVQVRARRDEQRNGSIALFFARIFGYQDSDGWALATATYRDDVAGFRITDHSGDIGLLPLALHTSVWNNLMAGISIAGDNYTYDESTRTISNGGDGVLEINLYPGAGPTQLPPGNFGTVDIGNPNNSTADISRQIRFGVNQSDLAYFGGELSFSAGPIMMNGDTGLSAAIKDDLISVQGQPRAIPIFDNVSGNGNNSMYRVIGFVGVRIMNVRLTGAMSQKQVIIQPAVYAFEGVITNGSSASRFVYTMPQLTR